jgi:hypothetical protein
MGNFGFLLGVGAANKANRVSAPRRRHHLVSVVVGILLAVLMAGGLLFFLALNSR